MMWCSFSSGRYFGDAVDEVRRTMRIQVQTREADIVHPIAEDRFIMQREQGIVQA